MPPALSVASLLVASHQVSRLVCIPPTPPPPIPQTRTPSGVPTETFFLPLSNLVEYLPSPSVEEGRRCGGANATHTQASPCIGCHGVECVQLEE